MYLIGACVEVLVNDGKVLQESSLSKVIDIFKSYNPSWKYVRVIMTDKDITERDVLKTSLPKAELLICLFHTMRTLRREIAVEKMGITTGQRSMCLEMLQQMAYSTSEDKYFELYTRFKECVPHTVLSLINSGIQFGNNGPLV